MRRDGGGELCWSPSVLSNLTSSSSSLTLPPAGTQIHHLTAGLSAPQGPSLEAPHNLEFQQAGVGDSYPGARAQRPRLLQPQHLRAARLASGIGAANAAGAVVPTARATPPAQNKRWLASSAACTARVGRAQLAAPAPALSPRRAPGTERG